MSKVHKAHYVLFESSSTLLGDLVFVAESESKSAFIDMYCGLLVFDSGAEKFSVNDKPHNSRVTHTCCRLTKLVDPADYDSDKDYQDELIVCGNDFSYDIGITAAIEELPF